MIAGLGHSRLDLFQFTLGKISFLPLLCLILGPLKGFLSGQTGHSALQGPLAFLPELQRYISRTTDANLDVFVKHFLIMKSHQNRYK